MHSSLSSAEHSSRSLHILRLGPHFRSARLHISDHAGQQGQYLTAALEAYRYGVSPETSCRITAVVVTICRYGRYYFGRDGG